jgi:hypothetical protein
VNPPLDVGARRYGRAVQLIAILIVAALWAKWGWILIAICVGIYVVNRAIKEWRRYDAKVQAAAAAEKERLDGLRARADQQQALRLAGDPRGTYGEYPPIPT